MIIKYNEFLIEKEFNQITNSIYILLESNGVWTSPNTIEWDLSTDKELPKEINSNLDRIKKIISDLDNESIRKYYIKLVNSLKKLPEKIRKFLLRHYTSVFLGFVSLTYLMGSADDKNLPNQSIEVIDPQIKKEITNIHINDIKNQPEEKSIEKEEKREMASFDVAQSQVKEVEAGYSDDRKDTGNWIEIKGIGKRFIGTNHGISAPILAKYLGRIPKKEDMQNLSYETALKIYKKDYWDAQNLGLLTDQSVANIIYDGCVNQGVRGMNQVVGDALDDMGVEIDGSVFKSDNIKKINTVNSAKLFKLIKKHRENRYKKARTWEVHGKGWLNRLAGIEYKKDFDQA